MLKMFTYLICYRNDTDECNSNLKNTIVLATELISLSNIFISYWAVLATIHVINSCFKIWPVASQRLTLPLIFFMNAH